LSKRTSHFSSTPQNSKKSPTLCLFHFSGDACPNQYNLGRGYKKRGAPLEEVDAVVKEMKQKGQKGNPLNQPLSLHYVTPLTLRIMGDKVS
jgi:hypothetical protein